MNFTIGKRQPIIILHEFPDANIKSVAYVYKGGAVAGNQVRNSLLVSEPYDRKATQLSRGEKWPRRPRRLVTIG